MTLQKKAAPKGPPTPQAAKSAKPPKAAKTTPSPAEKPASPVLQAALPEGETVTDSPEKIQQDIEAMLKLAPRRAAAVVEGQRCGLIAIVGRPNVGKSTLLNALVGQKISITSAKAQTTRHRITGIHAKGLTQFVFVDTPGFQTVHKNALNRSLNKTVLGAVGDVDLVLMVVEAGHFTQADAKVLGLLSKHVPVALIGNKFDLIHRRADVAPWLQAMQERHPFSEFVPMSAKNSKDVERLFAICEKYLPEQPWWYGDDELTDRSERFLVSEMVREKLFRLTGDELPYTSTVIIDKFDEEPSKTHKRFLRVAASIVVERDTHKAMVIGDKGERLKRIGTETRKELEKLLDAKVFIEIWVKVRSGWADDEARVRSFGYE